MMTLTEQWVGEYCYLTGVTKGGPPALLGRKFFKEGAHYIGFDDSFAEPIIVRAFYDPTEDARGVKLIEKANKAGEEADPFHYMIGYMQFMQIRFRRFLSIPPEVFGGRLADRQCYARHFPDYWFTDLMGPGDIKRYAEPQPFYVFNAMLVDDELKRERKRLFAHPLPNGSLYTPISVSLGKDDQPRADQSLCASLVGAIAPGLITPDRVEFYLSEDNFLTSLAVDDERLAEVEPYHIVLDYLENTRFFSEKPPLEGLDRSKVAAQVIGEYVLLTLPDPDDFGPTLCIKLAGEAGNRYIRVYLLSSYDMNSMRADVGREALWRIRQFQLNGDQHFSDMATDEKNISGRGFNSLLGRPYPSLKDYELELKCYTCAVACSPVSPPKKGGPAQDSVKVKYEFLSGVQWSMLFTWDEDSGLLEPSAIRRPTGITAIDMPGFLRAHARALRRETGTIDTTNFTLATMRRDNFAGGRKLSFVGFLDQPLS